MNALPDSTPAEEPSGRLDSPDEPITAVFFDGSPASYGGGSEMVYRLLTRLDDALVRPVLLAHTDDELCERLRGEVPVELVPFRGSLDQYDGQLLEQPVHRSVGTAARIAQFNVEARSTLRAADVVWCMNLRSLLTIAPFALSSATPVIWNIGLGRPSEGVYRALNEVGLRLADRVFIESDRQARRLFTDDQYERHEDALRIFSKGIDTDRFAPERSEPPLSSAPYAVGTAASLTPRKGVDAFVEAAIELLDRRDDLTFHVAGEPPHEADVAYERELRRRVEAAGHEDAVTFHGWVEEMPAFYDDLDAFVLPSLNEGVPGAVREALSMELPVVATDVGGTGEVVRDGETGRLIEPGDAGEIVAAVEALLEDPAAAREMGAAGRALIESEFSVAAYVSSYETFLREVVEA